MHLQVLSEVGEKNEESRRTIEWWIPLTLNIKKRLSLTKENLCCAVILLFNFSYRFYGHSKNHELRCCCLEYLNIVLKIKQDGVEKVEVVRIHKWFSIFLMYLRVRYHFSLDDYFRVQGVRVYQFKSAGIVRPCHAFQTIETNGSLEFLWTTGCGFWVPIIEHKSKFFLGKIFQDVAWLEKYFLAKLCSFIHTTFVPFFDDALRDVTWMLVNLQWQGYVF